MEVVVATPRQAPCREERGHTLIEVLIALAITMAVMAVVFRISGLGARLGAQVNARFDRDAIALRCLDQVARDLEDAGLGLVGGADRIEAGGDPLGGAPRLVTIRSNPDGIVAELNPGGLIPPELETRSLQLLTGEVMPAFK